MKKLICIVLAFQTCGPLVWQHEARASNNYWIQGATDNLLDGFYAETYIGGEEVPTFLGPREALVKAKLWNTDRKPMVVEIPYRDAVICVKRAVPTGDVCFDLYDLTER